MPLRAVEIKSSLLLKPPNTQFVIFFAGMFNLPILLALESYTGNNRTHMVRIPDPGRFELRLMDGSTNPYLLQAGVISAGIDGIKQKRDPGPPLFVNMYTDGNNYPNIKKLPSDLESSLEHLGNSEVLLSAFGEKNITSYLKLKAKELKDFNSKETFSKKKPITDWEKKNTLDC